MRGQPVVAVRALAPGVLALLIVSCTESRAPRERESAVDIESVASLMLPPWSLEWAEKEIISACMARSGFRFPPLEVLPRLAGSPQDQRVFPGLFTSDQARRQGYGSSLGRIATGAKRRTDPLLAESGIYAHCHRVLGSGIPMCSSGRKTRNRLAPCRCRELVTRWPRRRAVGRRLAAASTGRS